MSTATPTWTAGWWTRRGPRQSDAFRAGCSQKTDRHELHQAVRVGRSGRAPAARAAAWSAARTRTSSVASASVVRGVTERGGPGAGAHPLADELAHGARPVGDRSPDVTLHDAPGAAAASGAPSSPRGAPRRRDARARGLAAAPRSARAPRPSTATRLPRPRARPPASAREGGRRRAEPRAGSVSPGAQNVAEHGCRPGPLAPGGESHAGIRSTPASKDSTSTWALCRSR